jgi:hypothetical protein
MTSQEPRDGDFVAYIEALQRESEARLHRPQPPLGAPVHPGGHVTGSPEPGRPASPGIGTRSDIAAPVLSRLQADELLARLARTGGSSQARGTGIALAVGVVLLLFWFIADGGAIAFLTGLGLTLWSVSRLRRLGRPSPDAAKHTREQIAGLFGRSPRP